MRVMGIRVVGTCGRQVGILKVTLIALGVCGGAYLQDKSLAHCFTTILARVIHYPNDFTFRPLRNLPPVNLAQDIPPEEPANILLLDCRDPGSILHTIHHSLSNPCMSPLTITTTAYLILHC